MNYTRDFQAQVAHVIEDGRTANGVYGLKMFPEHFDSSAQSEWATRLPNLSYVYLIRDDVVDQAISLAIARQTSSYSHWSPELTAPSYNAEQIKRCLEFIVAGEARWRLFFSLNEIRPVVLKYSDLLDRPQQAVDAIAACVDVAEAPIDWGSVLTLPQRTGRNVEWRARFISDVATLSLLPTFRTDWTALDTL